MVLIHRQNAIREFIDGEAHVKGFLLAYLGLTQGYILLPEYESSKGYADFYMMPDLVRQPDIVYSYIVEVKYARRDTSDADIALLKRDAAEQLRRYADDGKVAHEREYPAWIDYAGVQGMGIGGTGEAGVQSGLRKCIRSLNMVSDFFNIYA
ncbi:PD-(D/E)XK nuclease domain-containing protein [Bacteroides ovatus]|nr:PD-(D/E)XK nuclease domain-containing protein [Bacteroides ovatus]